MGISINDDNNDDVVIFVSPISPLPSPRININSNTSWTLASKNHQNPDLTKKNSISPPYF
ncbi:predicted protein [Botrytis cinerea T4]|uniref:Uncharacterized protein n=1 Tax=Botryotinia fuckeliana (strain T4) TaxID=999810 RepID=G2YXQ9_BOTF4|nr:predicted protein [Botrytis cinerea T4]